MNNPQHPATHLEKEAFASALRQGLGRAMLHVTRHGLDDVLDLVLDACVHNQTFDAQCESDRVDWLFSMFDRSPHYPTLRAAILDALATETEAWDLMQLCGLAKEMALLGDERARDVLHDRVIEKASRPSMDDWLGAAEWVELTGVAGALELARIYGRRLMANPADCPSPNIFPMNPMVEQDFQEVLQRHALIEPEVEAYWTWLEKRNAAKPDSPPLDGDTIRQQGRQRFREKHPLAQVIENAKNGVGQFPVMYTSFGRHATPEELEEVYTYLINETEDSARLRLLWIFRRAPLPRLNEMLFDWAVGTHAELRAAAIAALAGVADGRVHTLARLKVSTGQLVGDDREALDLFVCNYQREDAQPIAQALAALETEPADAHKLGFSVIDLAKQVDDVELAGALAWVYEHTPCTNCRYTAVGQLDRRQALTAVMLNECRYDASEEIRSFAQERWNSVWFAPSKS